MTDAFHNGQVVYHKDLGTGRIVNIEESRLVVNFARTGIRYFAPSEAAEELSSTPYNADEDRDQAGDIDTDDLKRAIREVLREEGLVGTTTLAARWEDGEIVLKPGKVDLQSKSVPIETFFHKIVMVRNQLRMLEQNINSHKVLSDAEKVDLQQYITRCYGSLTTFNVLFAEKNDWFVGSKKEE